MTIQFTIWDWKDIQNIVGTVVSLDDSRQMLHYVRFRCEDSRFEAVASDGFRLAKLNGKCVMSERTRTELLIPPLKAPPKTVSVMVSNVVEGKYVVYFYDKGGVMIDCCTLDIPNGEYPDFDSKFLKPAIERRTEYSIAVNPAYLLDALNGMKNQDTVILEFGTAYEPFIVHPYKTEDLDAMSLVLPVRVFGGAT